MFNGITSKLIKPIELEWETPSRMLIKISETDEKGTYYKLLKGAIQYVHDSFDIKVSTSKDLFKKSENIWKSFRDTQISKANDNPNMSQQFNLLKDTVAYLVDDTGEIIDIYDLRTPERYAEFEEKHHNLMLEFSTATNYNKYYQEGSSGLVKLIIYKKSDNVATEDYIPAISLEYNAQKSTYNIYVGMVKFMSGLIFIPTLSSVSSYKQLCELVMCFDIDEVMKQAEVQAEALYNDYMRYMQNPIEISAREVSTFLKRAGYELDVDMEDKLNQINNIDDEVNSKAIQDYFNTFKDITGETALDILKLTEFRKTFRYNKMSILDLLLILSKEYTTSEKSNKITCELLGDILYKLYTSKDSDVVMVETVKNEVK